MYTLGHNFVPAPIHGGGLCHHGAGVIVSQLLRDQLIEAVQRIKKVLSLNYKTLQTYYKKQ